MKIASPSGLIRTIQAEPKPANTLPGLLLSVGTGLPLPVPSPVSLASGFLKGRAQTASGNAGRLLVPPTGALAPRHLLVTPAQVPFVVPEALLDPLEKMSKALARSVGHNFGRTVDALWFVFHVHDVIQHRNDSEGDRGEAVFKVAGLVPGIMEVFNDFSPGVKLPEAWPDNFDCLIRSGTAVYQGRTPGLTEMGVIPFDGAEIVSQLTKLAGATFDPSPKFQALTPYLAAPPPKAASPAPSTPPAAQRPPG